MNIIFSPMSFRINCICSGVMVNVAGDGVGLIGVKLN